MKFFAIATLLTILSLTSARPQQQHQQIDPAQLQAYYAQLDQQSGRSAGDATPIYEPGQQESEEQYIQQGQQIRVKDTVSEQARSQAPQAAAYVAPRVYHQQQQAAQAQQVQYVHQPQYKPAPKQTLVVRRPQPQPQHYQSAAPQPQQHYQKEEEDEQPEYDHEPQSYQFGFDVKDDEYTNYQNRKEVKDGDVIKGSYSVVDSDGFIRTVTYTADPKEGFKAQVVREPTDIVVKIPVPQPEHQKAPNHQYREPQPQPHQQPQHQPQQHQPQYRPQHKAAPHYQYQQ